MKIYCAGCEKEINARLTNGFEIYPHREDLQGLPFWKCDTCGNYVGCHHNRKHDSIKPLGIIPTAELRKARQRIHMILDPLWKVGALTRKEIYLILSEKLGWKYHTAKIRNIEEAETVYKLIMEHFYSGKENG